MQSFVVEAVQHVFITGQILKETIHTFLAIIHKIPGASKVDQFRPMALCNVIFKIITKIVASRLRSILHKLISPTQVAFIPDRNIKDNTILNHELIYCLNGKKGRIVSWLSKLTWPKLMTMLNDLS